MQNSHFDELLGIKRTSGNSEVSNFAWETHNTGSREVQQQQWAVPLYFCYSHFSGHLLLFQLAVDFSSVFEFCFGCCLGTWLNTLMSRNFLGCIVPLLLLNFCSGALCKQKWENSVSDDENKLYFKSEIRRIYFRKI